MENSEEGLKFSIGNFFKKRITLYKGQLGVYQDKLAFYTQNDSADVIKHNIFIKVRILEVYEQLVEIEVLDMTISDSANEDIINLIKNNMPKYVNPKIVKWQISKE